MADTFRCASKKPIRQLLSLSSAVVCSILPAFILQQQERNAMGARSHLRSKKSARAKTPAHNPGLASSEFRRMKGARLGDAKNPFLSGRKVQPKAITGKESAADLIDSAFLAFNAGRLRE